MIGCQRWSGSGTRCGWRLGVVFLVLLLTSAMIDQISMKDKKHLFFLEFRIPPLELVVDIARQVLESIPRQRSQLLASLISFGMEVVPNR